MWEGVRLQLLKVRCSNEGSDASAEMKEENSLMWLVKSILANVMRVRGSDFHWSEFVSNICMRWEEVRGCESKRYKESVWMG